MTAAIDTAALRKARGAFFTAPDIASYVTDWAVRSADDTVLEPSCGEAAFLLPAVARLRALGAGGDLAEQVRGAELHGESAALARRLLAEEGCAVRIDEGDFLLAEPESTFDAVIGNPPYVRYQNFSGEARAAARRAALRAGVSLTNLASSWAAFTVQSALFCAPGGRVGLVLPSEILSVNYAAPIRDFLMRTFRRVRLVLFTERVFPGVMEDVVLLLAEGHGQGPAAHCELIHARNAAALRHLAEDDVWTWAPRAGQRWSLALVSPGAAAAYEAATAHPGFTRLESWGDTTLGMVTGNNAFFTLTGAEVAARNLRPDDVVRLSPPGSRHLRRVDLTAERLDELDAVGSATWLFRPAGDPSPGARAYIREGERRGVHEAYKCRVRSPWWRVPYLRPADLLLTYMNADTARLCANPAGVHHLNSVHGLYLRPEAAEIGRDLLAVAALNSLTLLGAELVGRSYGGGVLKLEPREADAWPMPTPELVGRRAGALARLRPRVADLVGSGRLLDAAACVDEVVLADVVDAAQLAVLRDARRALHARRTARGSSR